MTQDEIIEMATKVWGKCDWHESALCHLEAFAKLVAAKERDACAKVCDATEGAEGKDLAKLIRARGEA